MKKLAARDWEDILQVSIPVFEGLLPRACDDIILDLIFALSSWHAYAKLRLHTTTTVRSLSAKTATLGTLLRRFKNQVCNIYHTRELPKEEAARGRRTAALAATRSAQGSRARAVPSESKVKTFNMSTYKLHALGDYVDAIIKFGPTDNYSTQVVSSIPRCAYSL